MDEHMSDKRFRATEVITDRRCNCSLRRVRRFLFGESRFYEGGKRRSNGGSSPWSINDFRSISIDPSGMKKSGKEKKWMMDFLRINESSWNFIIWKFERLKESEEIRSLLVAMHFEEREKARLN